MHIIIFAVGASYYVFVRLGQNGLTEPILPNSMCIFHIFPTLSVMLNRHFFQRIFERFPIHPSTLNISSA